MTSTLHCHQECYSSTQRRNVIISSLLKHIKSLGFNKFGETIQYIPTLAFIEMDIQIEQTKDHEVISKLNEPVQTLHHQLYPKDFKKFDLNSATHFFKEILISADSYAFLAKIDAEPVGYILCMLKTRKENEFQHEKKILYIDQISINDEFRKQGIGKKLMHKAFELANELHVTEIQLDHWVNNDSACSFFKQLGFRYYNYKMKK